MHHVCKWRDSRLLCVKTRGKVTGFQLSSREKTAEDVLVARTLKWISLSTYTSGADIETLLKWTIPNSSLASRLERVLMAGVTRKRWTAACTELDPTMQWQPYTTWVWPITWTTKLALVRVVLHQSNSRCIIGSGKGSWKRRWSW